MYRVIIILCCLSNLIYADKEVKLSFEPDRTIVQNSKLEFKLWLPDSNNKVIFDTIQTFSAAVRLEPEPTSSISQTSVNLDFTLKEFKISLLQDGNSTVVDSNSGKSSSEGRQLAEIIDKPFVLTFNKGSIVEDKQSDIVRIKKELPFFQEISLNQFLEEFFQPIWVLAEKDLSVGKEIEVDSKLRFPTWPHTWKYQITKIDDKSIEATLKGIVKSEKINLNKMFSEPTAPLDVYLGGTITGTIRWNRNNALLYQMNLLGKYNGTLESTTGSIPIIFTLKHSVTSR